MQVSEGGLLPGGVVSELGKLREGVHGDAVEAEGSGPDPIQGPDGAGGGEGSEQPRDEEDAQLVGPHVVRNRRRHRLRDFRTHRTRGQNGGRTRRRALVRRLRRLRLALRLLLHRVRRRNPRRRCSLLTLKNKDILSLKFMHIF